MFAVSPNLRVIFPGLADDLLAGRDHIQMPQGATLRFALFAERRARIAGPMGAHRILTVREDFETFTEVFFRPLAWVLAPTVTDGLHIDDELLGGDRLVKGGSERPWPAAGRRALLRCGDDGQLVTLDSGLAGQESSAAATGRRRRVCPAAARRAAPDGKYTAQQRDSDHKGPRGGARATIRTGGWLSVR